MTVRPELSEPRFCAGQNRSVLAEDLSGVRNWDYRYCWLRDSVLTLDALLEGGYVDEALAFGRWALRAGAGDVSKLQIMYGTEGQRQLEEIELDWLGGYEGSRPVRVGNAAANQFQLDVYGEVAGVAYATSMVTGSIDARNWPRVLLPKWPADLLSRAPG